MAIFDNRYEQEQLLGRGAFSEVWKVRDTQTGVALALKIYNPTGDVNENGNEILTHEFALMVNANHKNLLRPLFFAICDNRPYLILPYCQKGNIGKMVGKMTEEEAWKLIRDCGSALAYLHAMNPPILHQDIKPANILMNDNGDYMLTDFGVSTQAKQSLSRVSNQEKDLLSAGTISYMAPERFSKQNLPIMANDIYSLGSTVYEMLSGLLPFGNDGGLLQKKGAEIPELPGSYSPLLKRTLEKCLEEEPWARPTASRLENIANEALKHPETRNQIPEVFNATSQSEVPQSQRNAAQASIKGTVMGAAMDAPVSKGTVMGPAIETPINATVIGTSKQHNSENPYTSANPYASGNPYTSSNPQNSVPPQNNTKKGLWAAFAIAAVLAVGIGIFFALKSPSQGADEEVALSPEALQEKKFNTAMELFKYDNPDSVKLAFDQMKVLAYDGHQEAIFEVAKTYAWIPNDSESVRRKTLMGWQIHDDDKNGLKGAPINDDYNKDAINWLQKSIDVQVPKFHKSLYWLAFYYYFGLGTAKDQAKAKQLFQQASEEAGKDMDLEFKKKIDKTLEQLNR